MRRPLLIIVIVILALLSCFTWVGEGGAVREAPGGEAVVLDAGPHLRLPLYHRVYRYDTSPVILDEAVSILTKDSATFKVPCRLEARVSQGDILTFHKSSSGREPAAYILETARRAILDAAKTMSTDQILSPAAADLIAQSVSAEMIARGISDDGLEIGSPGPQVVFNAVLDYLDRKFPASARRLAESSLARNPKEALFHTAVGVVLEAEGKPREAEERYIEALYLNPTAIEPMSRLYLLSQRSGDAAVLSRMERLLEASLAKNRESAVHHDWLGQVYMRTGRQDLAEMAFNTAIGLAPQTPEFHVSLGSLRAGQGRLDDAQAEYRKALEIRPDHPLALYNLGVTFALEGDIEQAIANFEKAAQSAPPAVALLNAMAQAYEQSGQTAKAVEALRRSLAQRPDQKERAADLRRLEAQVKKG